MDFNSLVNEKIDLAVLKERDLEKPRTYLGGSRLGVECERALQYEYMGTKKDSDFNSKILKIFQTGHLYEDLAIKWLKSAGFDLKTEKENGDQFGFSVDDGKIAGHVDGIIYEAPKNLNLKFPMLWESKSLNNSNFNNMVKNRVKKSKPIYYSQLQIYMACMEQEIPGISYNPAMFTCVNKDTSEVYHELVEFDIDYAQRLYDKGSRIIKSSEEGILLPREYSSKTFFKCKFCSWNKKCWEEK